MDGMYPVDGQKHAWAGHSCGAVKDNALFFPYASPSGKAEGSADIHEPEYHSLSHDWLTGNRTDIYTSSFFVTW